MKITLFFLYLVAIAGSIILPSIAFFSRREVYERWAKIVCVLVCIFGVAWSSSGLVMLHWRDALSRNTFDYIHTARSQLGGAIAGLLLSVVIARPWKKIAVEKSQPSA
ncbi:MAG TPA: hypothetical protein VHG89_12855 [Verrucomicrobiae bacterium]|nr:hypothetical protein [Verrucomicrobiae bacterium]